MTYDDWKTTEPDYDGPVGECDVCLKRAPLNRLWVTGIETLACEECQENNERAWLRVPAPDENT